MVRAFSWVLAAVVICGGAVGCVSIGGGESHNHTTNIHIDTPEGKLRHVVMFRFKEDATAAQIREVEEAFAALPSKIPQIKGFEWGTNNSPEGLDMGYTHVFLLTFDDDAGRAAYLPHPDHRAFGALLGPILDEVHVMDYYAR